MGLVLSGPYFHRLLLTVGDRQPKQLGGPTHLQFAFEDMEAVYREVGGREPFSQSVCDTW